MSGGSDLQPWSAYWSSGGRTGSRGCLPGGVPTIQAVQQQLWTEEAKPLRKAASVLDLATGDGAVLRIMLSVRRDLKLTGVDLAQDLPAAPAGIGLKSGVAAERLPFPDGRFDLVTSQFGIEYADVPAALSEVARVLRAGGRCTFLLHHAEGPVVRHNRQRAEALRWAVDDGDFLQRAKGLARGQVLGRAAPMPQDFAQAVLAARKAWASQSVAAEFREAVLQVLEANRRRGSSDAISALEELEWRASGELGRIGTLVHAAMSKNGIGELTREMSRRGLRVLPAVPVQESPERPPFGWLLKAQS